MATESESSKDTVSSPKILIVDDDGDLRSTLEEYFTHRGFVVLEAPDATRARQLSETNVLDIALVDLHLPDENGLSLCKFLQEERRLPVIMLTGDIDPTERVIGLEIGADDFISKPFELREVLARTRSVLRRSKSNSDRPDHSNPFEALLLKSLSNGRAERLLLAIMFCDIVNSTSMAEHLGDESWTGQLSEFEKTTSQIIGDAPGLTVKWMGDGLLAVFTTPGRALHAARLIHQRSEQHGLELRIGLHCGECERQDQDLAGIAVHIAARVMNTAQPGQTVVTSTVKEVMSGGGVDFVDFGKHDLKGIGMPWQLFTV